MPIGEPIRMPKTGVDSFFEGLHNSQAIFNSLVNNRVNQGNLAIKQQGEQRAQTLLPYLIQKYKDAHNLTPLQRQHLAAQIESAAAMAETHRSNAEMNRWIMKGLKQSSEPSSPTSMPAMQQGNPQETDGMSRHDLISTANADQANFDQEHGMANTMPQNEASNVMPNMTPWTGQGSPEQLAASQNAPAQMPPIAPQEQKEMAGMPPSSMPEHKPTDEIQFGAEEIIKPGNKNAEFVDEMAKRGIGTDQFKPKITRSPIDANGYRYTYYPSGKETRQKVAPSLEEKEEIKAKQAENKFEAKTNKIESAKLETSDNEIIKSIKILKAMNKILENNPKLTGVSYALPFGIGTGLKRAANSDPLTSFDNMAGQLQGIIAKNTTGARTGVGALNWAKLVKPDVGLGVNANKGSIRTNLEMLLSAFEEDKKAWENKNPGKKYHLELPEVNDVLSNKEKNNNLKEMTLDEWAEDAISKGADRQAVMAELAKLKSKGGQ